MRVLLVGGTRNLGPDIVRGLIGRGCEVAVLNRGVTAPGAVLPAGVEQLRADRSDFEQLFGVLRGREFDAVVDRTLYTGVVRSIFSHAN